MKDLRVVFMGTPEFAVNILDVLIKNTNVVLVCTQPDALVGRKRILTPSPVAKRAIESGIEVFKPNRIRDDYNKIIECKPDIIITCAYGQIIPKILLDYPVHKCVNVHASLLPKLRGGAPIHHAIIDGHSETGITIMYMDEGMDSGDIIKKESIKINDEDTLDSLSSKLSSLGANLLIETLPDIINKKVNRIKQNEDEVTFGYIIKKSDELVDFTRTSREVFNKIRGLNSNPGAYFLMNGEVVKVYESRIGTNKGEISTINNIYKDGIGIGTSDGEIIITKIKPAGKKEVLVRDYLNGIKKNELIGVKLNEEIE